jgi:hypothetical protein
VADKLTLDLQMQVAMRCEMVTVTSGLALETGSVNTGSVITSRQISELPLIDGAAYQLATLARVLFTPAIRRLQSELQTAPLLRFAQTAALVLIR